MRNSFTFYNPTKLIFGKRTTRTIEREIPTYGKKFCLFMVEEVLNETDYMSKLSLDLNGNRFKVFELPGVEPNPRISTVRKGVEICKKEDIEFLLAVGGGSVIDCTKAIAAGAKYDGDAWDFVTKKAPKEALPFGTVLTLAATGSEMNSGSVITNWETNEKYGWGSALRLSAILYFRSCSYVYGSKRSNDLWDC